MTDIREIYTRGYVKFNEPDGLDLIRPDEFTLANCSERYRDNGREALPKELGDRLNAFGNYLKTKYIDQLWPEAEFDNFIMWEGVDKDVTGWHTDIFEGYDVFFLYYFDPQSAETGGSVNFKWGTLEDNEQTAQYYPQPGDLFLINNHDRGFWHRGEYSQVRRRMSCFEFVVGDEKWKS
jgi:hypothetical protein